MCRSLLKEICPRLPPKEKGPCSPFQKPLREKSIFHPLLLPGSFLSFPNPSLPSPSKTLHIFGKIKVSPLILQGLLTACRDRPTGSLELENNADSSCDGPGPGKMNWPTSARHLQNKLQSSTQGCCFFLFFSSKFSYLSLPLFPSSLQTATDPGTAAAPHAFNSLLAAARVKHLFPFNLQIS